MTQGVLRHPPTPKISIYRLSASFGILPYLFPCFGTFGIEFTVCDFSISILGLETVKDFFFPLQANEIAHTLELVSSCPTFPLPLVFNEEQSLFCSPTFLIAT